jgi:tetratricopeptide (TPR) repeat protein
MGVGSLTVDAAEVVSSNPSPVQRRLSTVLAASLIVLVTAAVFANGLRGVFIFDDVFAILNNGSIHHLWPIGPVLHPPLDVTTASGRPLVNLSFALNYYFGGENPWGYHVVNVLIHIFAALLLFGVLRRSFRLPALADRLGRAATPLALAVALLWAVHPLQTESVTYVAQRAESGIGLLYLLVLYCVIRGASSEGGWWFVDSGRKAGAGASPLPSTVHRPPSALLWYIAAILACLLAMAYKETIVSVPLFVLLYDRTLLSGSFREALRRRWALYLGLLATEGLLAYLVLTASLPASYVKGGVTSWTYSRTQPEVILYYLRLCFWPQPLCLDRCWYVARTPGEIIPGMIVVALLLAATLYGLCRRKSWSLLGAWFFMILAPTSSFLPLYELAAEHRMYLPLAAVATAVVLGCYGLHRWLGRHIPRRWGAVVLGGVTLTAVAALAAVSVARNADYRSEIGMWSDTVNKAPWNPDAHSALSAYLVLAGRLDEAIAQLQAAVALRPRWVKDRDALATLLATEGRTAEAMVHWSKALECDPTHATANYNVGLILQEQGRLAEAAAHYETAIAREPRLALAHGALAGVLQRLGKPAAAIAHYQKALKIEPNSLEFHNGLGGLLVQERRFDDAIAHFEQAAAIDPNNLAALINLGNVFAQLSRPERAISYYQKALAIDPHCAEAHHFLAGVLHGQGRVQEAITHWRQALAARPQYVEACYSLGQALYENGQTQDALAQFRAAETMRKSGGR